MEKFLEKYFRNILWGTEKEPIFASLFSESNMLKRIMALKNLVLPAYMRCQYSYS
jgi:hypothetical protein